MSKFLKSWKTSLAGIIGAAIFALGASGVEIVDVNSWGEIVGVLIGILGVGIGAKDGDKSTEDVS